MSWFLHSSRNKLKYMLTWLEEHVWARNVLFMLLFAFLSFLFGLISFYVPGLSSTQSDFREIPLLISIFYFSNPLFLLGVSLLSFLWLIPSVSFWSAFIIHFLALIVSWYFFYWIKNAKLNTAFEGTIWFIYISVFYYLCLIFPIQFVMHRLLSLDLGESFIDFYEKMIFSSRFEILSTALIVALYLVQYKGIKALKEHDEKLTETVKKRTAELEMSNEELWASNEELKATNEELYYKTEIINNQNTELERTLNELEITQARLLQADKMASLGILTAGVAHEINNPLNYIMGSYEGLKNYFEEQNIHNEMINILLNSLKTGVFRAADIVKSLNQFGRNNENFNEDCDILNIIQNCLLMLHNQLKSKIELATEFPPQAIIIKGNVGKLYQVFINLLTNAIQAIPNKGKISINVEVNSDFVQIKIRDTGVGIKEENLSKIVDPFYTTKEPGKGTGLGLSIVYNIIQDHNGSLDFESEVQKGTLVKISLPIKINNINGET